MHKWVKLESSLEEWMGFSLEMTILWGLRSKQRNRKVGGSTGGRTECEVRVATGTWCCLPQLFAPLPVSVTILPRAGEIRTRKIMFLSEESKVYLWACVCLPLSIFILVFEDFVG